MLSEFRGYIFDKFGRNINFFFSRSRNVHFRGTPRLKNQKLRNNNIQWSRCPNSPLPVSFFIFLGYCQQKLPEGKMPQIISELGGSTTEVKCWITQDLHSGFGDGWLSHVGAECKWSFNSRSLWTLCVLSSVIKSLKID